MLIEYGFFENFHIDENSHNRVKDKPGVTYDKAAAFKMRATRDSWYTKLIRLPDTLSEYDMFDPKGMIKRHSQFVGEHFVPLHDIKLYGFGTLLDLIRPTNGMYRITLEGEFIGGISDDLSGFNYMSLGVFFEDPTDALIFKLTL